MNIFVGNLNYAVSEDDLKSIFEEFGELSSVKVIKDRFTSRSKGFGFVEMDNDEDAKKAIEQLNGTEVEGRDIVVNESIKKERDSREGGYHKDRRSDSRNENRY